MKICFTLPSAHIGGFRTFTINTGKQFQRDGHEVSVLITARGHATEDLGDIDLIKREMNLHLCLQKRVFFRSLFLKKVVNAIENISPDVLIINHTLWPLAALPYLNPAIKRILVVHNITEEELHEPEANADWWNAVVAVGPGVYNFLLNNWSKEKVHLIPVGVNEPSLLCRHDFSNSPLRICYIGRLSQPQKNILMLPIIAKGLSEKKVKFQMDIIGDGDDKHTLKKQIDELGLAESFVFRGTCDHYKVENILSEQNILLLPSNYESIGHVLEEAQILGVVPIASRLEDSTAFVVTNKENGMLCSSDKADEFISAIVNLDENRNEMKRLSENGIKNVKEKFLISNIASQYYQLFNYLDNSLNRNKKQKHYYFGFNAIPSKLLPPRYKTLYRVIKKKVRFYNEK